MAKAIRRRAQKSLRRSFVFWMVFVSFVPLAFITGLSVVKYQEAMDRELVIRLNSNLREVTSFLAQFDESAQALKRRVSSYEPTLQAFELSQAGVLAAQFDDQLSSPHSSRVNSYNSEGVQFLSLLRAEDGRLEPATKNSRNVGTVAMTEKHRRQVVDSGLVRSLEVNDDLSVDLMASFPVKRPNGELVGFLEQTLRLNSAFLLTMKQRFGLEVTLLDSKGGMLLSSQEYLRDFPRDFFRLDLEAPDQIRDQKLRGEPKGIYARKFNWGESSFGLALVASKSETVELLRTVNLALLGVVAVLVVVLLISIAAISRTLVRPLDDLVQATQIIRLGENVQEIPVKSETEIGLLTESFNDMSRSILRVRAELKAKISELEKANRELRETQTRLVHTSKMSSLGQLVAGVAHELNNPIGFIFSNMNHLRDYSDRLIRYADGVTANPSSEKRLREELEIDFVRTDLPKLIRSCEDGAKRTRDIVLGLRNFSRLEEDQVRELSLNQALEDTLSLLTGEIKGRIQVHRRYGEIPSIQCHPTQINQVLMNLLTNAIQAISGDGNLWVTTRKQTHGRKKDFVQISIQDSGEGITPENVGKIFDPFFSTKEVGKGTGLGLSISYGIVEKHGGTIQVNSKPGLGSEFVVTLPVLPPT